jgi:hypothetical protein
MDATPAGLPPDRTRTITAAATGTNPGKPGAIEYRSGSLGNTGCRASPRTPGISLMTQIAAEARQSGSIAGARRLDDTRSRQAGSQHCALSTKPGSMEPFLTR